MEKANFIARAEIEIDASREKVWEALIKPDLIREYLHGTRISTDWKVGSPITYKGEWKGRAYEDKGKVLQVEREERLVTTFWSSLSGEPDDPENYKTVTYALSNGNRGTRLTLTQDNNKSREEAQHSERNWKAVLEKIKELLEEQSLAPGSKPVPA